MSADLAKVKKSHSHEYLSFPQTTEIDTLENK